MPNDAKLGLIVGVGLVIALSSAFFRKDATDNSSTARQTVAASQSPVTEPARHQFRSVDASNTSRVADTAKSQRHVVREGDTLASLAKHYYGDESKSTEITRANREVVTGDQLVPGTVLDIPALPANATSDSDQPGNNS